MKKFINKNLVIFAISFSLFFISLEFVAKFLNSILKFPHANVDLSVGGKDIVEYQSTYIKDRELFWKLDPSWRECNSYGFRGQEFSLDKDRNTFRVICMGDSVTFGAHTAIGYTYPKVLEKLLKSKFPSGNFEVINAAVPGYTSYQGLILLKKYILNYHPDLIIIYYGVNDRSGSYKSDKDQKKLPNLVINAVNHLRNYHFFILFNRIVLHLKYPPARKRIYPAHRVSPDDYRKNLSSMMEIAKSRGIKTLFIVNPVFYSPETKIVSTNGLYYPPDNILKFDIYVFFKKRGSKSEKFFKDDVRPLNFHLTGEGQRVLAEEICETLVNNSFIQ